MPEVEIRVHGTASRASPRYILQIGSIPVNFFRFVRYFRDDYYI
ncbi:hypothetical protein SAMN05216386_1685 [Nitrosospira briensis]|uniref:Uncharacterized protein n=1 Tax=Nitrosospira briensis TaxID=35799 RepID=A0A1I5BIJ6_9PROT|nr:hypothetical protein SAMN05216386_1685 [Nitrosospira briensis]